MKGIIISILVLMCLPFVAWFVFLRAPAEPPKDTDTTPSPAETVVEPIQREIEPQEETLDALTDLDALIDGLDDLKYEQVAQPE